MNYHIVSGGRDTHLSMTSLANNAKKETGSGIRCYRSGRNKPFQEIHSFPDPKT